MIQKLSYYTGILGAILFGFTTIIAGFQYSGYSFISQFISEIYAVDAPNADTIRYYFYLPAGILFVLFALFANASLPKSKLKTLGFVLFGFGYGFGTILCSMYNCDAGCNTKSIDPSISQIIHNLMGMITYCIVPPAILLIAIAAKKWAETALFTKLSYISSFLSFASFMFLTANLDSPIKGLLQRIIEGSILFWIITCSVYVRKIFSTNLKSVPKLQDKI